MKETLIQRTILDGFNQMGILALRYRNLRLKRRPEPFTVGIPDILALVLPRKAKYGVLMFVEVKNEDGKQSPEQKIWQTRIESSGGIYVLARDWDTVEKAICNVLYGTFKRATS